MGDLPSTITEAAARLRNGTVSSRELIGEVLARADAANRHIGAVLSRYALHSQRRTPIRPPPPCPVQQ